MSQAAEALGLLSMLGSAVGFWLLLLQDMHNTAHKGRHDQREQ